MPRILRLVNDAPTPQYGLTNYMQQPVIIKKDSKIALQSLSALFEDRNSYEILFTDFLRMGVNDGTTTHKYDAKLIPGKFSNFSQFQEALNKALANPKSNTNNDQLLGVVSIVHQQQSGNKVAIDLYAEDEGAAAYDEWNTTVPIVPLPEYNMVFQGQPGTFTIASSVQGEAPTGNVRAVSSQQFSTVNGRWIWTVQRPDGQDPEDPFSWGYEEDIIAYAVADGAKITPNAWYDDCAYCAVVLTGLSEIAGAPTAEYSIIYNSTDNYDTGIEVEYGDTCYMRIYYSAPDASLVFGVAITNPNAPGPDHVKFANKFLLTQAAPTFTRLCTFAQAGTGDNGEYVSGTAAVPDTTTEVQPTAQNRIFTGYLEMSPLLARQLGFDATSYSEISSGEDHVSFISDSEPQSELLRNGLIITLEAIGIVGYDGLSHSSNSIIGVITNNELEDNIGFTNYAGYYPVKIPVNNMMDMNINQFTCRFYGRSLQEQPLKISESTNINLLIYDADES